MPGPHDRVDDIESFYHVLSWVVLRFVQHGMRPSILAHYLNGYFDEAIPENGQYLLEVLRKTLLARYLENPEMRKKYSHLRHQLMTLPRDEALKLADPQDADERSALTEYREVCRTLPLLDKPYWLSDTILQALNDPEWPTDDRGAAPQPYVDMHPLGEARRKGSTDIALIDYSDEESGCSD
ncbi:hypothetical protein AX17_004352 [Amanita inopinata Kibby_2008]|nr:hypothetical protein AX17_004352 [Amanita inopinata Kibby_2008]